MRGEHRQDSDPPRVQMPTEVLERLSRLGGPVQSTPPDHQRAGTRRIPRMHGGDLVKHPPMPVVDRERRRVGLVSAEHGTPTRAGCDLPSRGSSARSAREIRRRACAGSCAAPDRRAIRPPPTPDQGRRRRRGPRPSSCPPGAPAGPPRQHRGTSTAGTTPRGGRVGVAPASRPGEAQEGGTRAAGAIPRTWRSKPPREARGG